MTIPVLLANTTENVMVFGASAVVLLATPLAHFVSRKPEVVPSQIS